MCKVDLKQQLELTDFFTKKELQQFKKMEVWPLYKEVMLPRWERITSILGYNESPYHFALWVNYKLRGGKKLC